MDEFFGTTPDGQEARVFTLENPFLRVRVTNYGGRIVSIQTPDRHGARDHVALGFDDLAGFVAAGGSFSALLGRTANRIGGGRFSLDGVTYELSKNNDGSTLHGGQTGFGKKLWRVEVFDGARLVLGVASPDGDQGYPGEVQARATFGLDDSGLTLTLEAEVSQATPLVLSAHPYFNLAGPGAMDMLDHEITIAADHFLPTDARQIPTGEIRPVVGTAFDFRRPMPAGARIRETDPQLLIGKGYDHFYIVNGSPGGEARFAVRVRHAGTGRVMEIFTTQRGVQFYTGNSLAGSFAGRGGAYRQSAGVAFEPHGFPDAPNHLEFPSVIVRPGEGYREVIRYVFSVEH
jgi:aldose 1-epimerase